MDINYGFENLKPSFCSKKFWKRIMAHKFKKSSVRKKLKDYIKQFILLA